MAALRLRARVVASIVVALASLAGRRALADAPEPAARSAEAEVSREGAVPAAPPPEPAALPGETAVSEEGAWEHFIGASVGIDLRAEEVEVLKRYALADGRSFWSGGPGAGVGLTLSLHFRAPIAFEDSGEASWIDFGVGLGDATHYVRWRDGDTGLSTAIVETEISVRIGPRFASGHVRAVGGRARWWGYAVAIEWMPTYVYFFGHEPLGSGGQMNSAGLGVSLDVGQWTPGHGVGGPLFRLSVGWLPYVNALPTVLTAGVGCAFY